MSHDHHNGPQSGKSLRRLLGIHPDSVDPDKDFFEREGARPGERTKAAGCGLLAVAVGVGLAFAYPLVGVPIAVVGVLAIIGSIPSRS